MVSRRDFVLSGFAISALPALSTATLARPVKAAEPLLPELALAPLYKVIYDRRFPASVVYGLEAERRGLSTHAINGDMTNIWYHELHPRWKQNPAAIAGLTAHGPLFCLERLAWDFKMRVIFREPRADGLTSWVIAPRSAL
jgi:hypothetical protein